MSTERGPSGPPSDPEGRAGVPARQDSAITAGGQGVPPHQPKRNIWRDGLWIGATAFVIITIGAFYQTWLHLGPEGREKRAALKGDGVNVGSYGFDLTLLAEGINPNEIVTTGLRKDEVPVMEEPGFISVEENASLSGHEKYVLPTDRVVGVVHEGSLRAYPIQVMQIHQVANSAEPAWPLSLSYDPSCELVSLLANGSQNCVAEFRGLFGVSGLAYKGVSLLFDRGWVRLSLPDLPEESQATEPGRQSLWNPLLSHALSGPASQPYMGEGYDARGIPVGGVSVLQWRDWVAAHPDTMILKREEARLEQYKKDLYGPYYLSEKLPYRVNPQIPPGTLAELGLRQKSRGIGFSRGDKRCFVAHEVMLQNATYSDDGLGSWSCTIWNNRIELRCRKADVGFTPSTVWIVSESESNVTAPPIPLIFLFAWYANYPETYILQADGQLVKP